MAMPNLDNKGFLEKYLKYVLLAGAGVAVFWFWGNIVPFVKLTLENTFKSMLYLGGIAFVAGFVWLKPNFILNTYKNFCNYIEDFFVNKDPLSYMDRYAEYLADKMVSLNASIVALDGKRTKVKRMLTELKEKVESNKELGSAAMKMNPPNKNAASVYGIKIQRDMESIHLFTPMYDRMTKYIDFMSKLYDNWKYSREGLVYQIQSKRTEYEMFKETVKGLKSAEDLINSDSEQAQLYGKSLKAFEENVTQKIAYIEDFEKRSKDIILNISLEKQVAEDKGLNILEQYMNDSNIFLPNFSAQDIEYEELSSGPKESTKFNLLKK